MFEITGPSGRPVRPGDSTVVLTINGCPHVIAAHDAITIGEALTVVGCRAVSCCAHLPDGEAHGHKSPGQCRSYAEGQ